jgi:hypothetical protein
MSPIRNLPRSLGWLAVTMALTIGLSFVYALRQAHAAGEPVPLPNLVADPPDNVSLETSSTEGGLKSSGESKLLLRFNGYVHNKGPGALDFRGSRERPKVAGRTEKEVEEEVDEHADKEEELPQKIEEELAKPPMKAFQRVFASNGTPPTTKPGTPSNKEENEKYLEREHEDEPSAAELVYVNADGHHHFHLQHVAKYSLWNATKTAEVAPAQKVGFCLEDSEHIEPKVGPTYPVYADNVAPFRDFCQRYRPNATSLYEGISPGWRDVYGSELAFQWVEVSNVLPGEYWLREDVNPDGFVKESSEPNTPAYASSPTIIPGFDALAGSTRAQAGEAEVVTLTSKAWEDSNAPRYSIVSPPQHGTLGAIDKNQVTYTPDAGYTGPDSFSFTAADPDSQFPTHPAIVTVSIEVGEKEAGARALLAGDDTSTYGEPDQTVVGHEEAFQFTARSTGIVEQLELRTDASPDPGVSGVAMGIFADEGGRPGQVLGAATASGQPAASSWIGATGLATTVTRGTTYWLVMLPLGEAGRELHFDAAASLNAGTGNLESEADSLTQATAESSWAPYDQGPVGFQALGSTLQPSVSISGAQAEMIAGTAVTLTANVGNDDGGVEWSVSGGGTLAAEAGEGLTSLYTASSVPGTVTITARLRDDPSVSAQQTIGVVAAPAPVAIPGVTTGAINGSAGSTSGGAPSGASGRAGVRISNRPSGVSRPQVMLIGRKLVMSTRATIAGRVRLSAYLDGRRLGTCAAPTPANRIFTCRLTLGSRVSLRAPIRVLASLREHGLIFTSSSSAKRIPEMKMMPAGLGAQVASLAGRSWCSPSTLVPTLSSR